MEGAPPDEGRASAESRGAHHVDSVGVLDVNRNVDGEVAAPSAEAEARGASETLHLPTLLADSCYIEDAARGANRGDDQAHHFFSDWAYALCEPFGIDGDSWPCCTLGRSGSL